MPFPFSKSENSSIPSSLLFWMMALVMLSATYLLGFEVERPQFGLLIGCYGILFGGYLLALFMPKSRRDLYYFIGLGVAMRFLLILSFPNLSDDIYRFIWDGHLLNAGINPFDHLPIYFIENEVKVPGLSRDLLQHLNSPEYFTIYPPVAQATFAISSWLFPESWYGSAVVMKSFLFLAEVGSIYLIVQLLQSAELPITRVLIYALNPLMIIEITGNLHFEGAMIFFFLAAGWLLQKNKIWWSAVAFAFSVASKLLPLLFLPFLLVRLGWKKAIEYYVIVGMVVTALFAPLLNGLFVENFSNSLHLYFQKFEFNASVYYVLRWVGYQVKGWNMIGVIGPILALGTLVGVCGVAFREIFQKGIADKKSSIDWLSWLAHCLFAISLYLVFTTTVHPWYVALPLVCCVFTRWRYPVCWSGLIFLTYINYSYPVYTENLFVVGIEYLFTGLFFLYELFLVQSLYLRR